MMTTSGSEEGHLYSLNLNPKVTIFFFFFFFFIQVIFACNASASVYAGLPAMTESEETSLSVSVMNSKRKVIYIYTCK